MRDSIKVSGLVVREVKTGEADKLLTLICNGIGRIDVSGKGVRSLKSPHITTAQLFAYGTFVLSRGKKYYYISESELIEPFFGLRSDIERVSLAAYLADILCDLSPEGIEDESLLRLTLNAYYALSEKKDIPLPKIKSAYEFKAACIAGFCPDLSVCSRCGCDERTKMYLDVMNGGLVCDGCKTAVALENEIGETGTAIIHLPVSRGALGALRYIAESDEKRFLSFSTDAADEKLLSGITERYLTEHLEHGFHSLDFYKSLIISR